VRPRDRNSTAPAADNSPDRPLLQFLFNSSAFRLRASALRLRSDRPALDVARSNSRHVPAQRSNIGIVEPERGFFWLLSLPFSMTHLGDRHRVLHLLVLQLVRPLR